MKGRYRTRFYSMADTRHIIIQELQTINLGALAFWQNGFTYYMTVFRSRQIQLRVVEGMGKITLYVVVHFDVS